MRRRKLVRPKPGRRESVFDTYATQSQFSPRAAEPTAAWPGTRKKLAVLAARAAAGEELFSPRDTNCLPRCRTVVRDARGIVVVLDREEPEL